MGLFSSKKKTVVSASVGRLFKDEDIQPRIKAGVVSYVRGKSPYDSIGSMIIGEAPKRIDRRAERIVRRISNGAPYAYGQFTSSIIEEDLGPASTYIDNYLTTTYGATVDKKYELLEETHLSHMAWLELIRQYEYNPVTNELAQVSALRGRPCFLEDGQIYYCSATLAQINEIEDLDTIGLSFDHGATEIRAQDYTRVRKPWIEDTVGDKDTFKFSYIYVVRKEQTVVTRLSDDTVVSDTTQLFGGPPLVWEAIIETQMSQTTTDDGVESTVLTITNVGYRIRKVIDFLRYEVSGSFDETNALTEADSTLIDPTLEDTSAVESNTNKEYFMVSFSYLVGGLVQYGYYTYEIGSGTIPDLDDLLGLGDSEENYFPNIYFRRDGHALNREVDRNTDRYRQSKKLCKRLDLNYSDLTDSLHESVGSLDKVRTMHMNFCIPVNESSELQRKYMHFWAEKMYGLGTNIGGTYPAKETRTGQIISYFDNVFEHRIVFTNISKEVAVLSLGLVGTFHIDITTIATPGGFSFSNFKRKVNRKYVHNIYKQISETECIVYRILGLTSIQIVQPGYQDTAIADAKHLVIPVNLDLLKKLIGKEREKLMAQSLHIYVHTSQVIKTKWYQRGIFRVLLTIIAVILAIIPGGQPFSIQLFLTTLAINIAIQAVVTIVIKFLVKELKLKGWVAGLVVTIGIFATGVIAYDMSAMLNVPVLMNTLNVALKFVTMGAQIEFAEYAKEFAAWTVDAKKQMDLLEEAQNGIRRSEVNFHPLFSPNTTIKEYYVLGQSSNEYYAKKMLSFDIVGLVYGQIGSYYDVLLSLPDPDFS